MTGLTGFTGYGNIDLSTFLSCFILYIPSKFLFPIKPNVHLCTLPGLQAHPGGGLIDVLQKINFHCSGAGCPAPGAQSPSYGGMEVKTVAYSAARTGITNFPFFVASSATSRGKSSPRISTLTVGFLDSNTSIRYCWANS